MPRNHTCAVCDTPYPSRQQAAECERRCDTTPQPWADNEAQS